MRYRVKVRSHRWSNRRRWEWACPFCPELPIGSTTRARAWREATRHAAKCSSLHWANWDAACRSCKLYGRVARACPICLGRGFEAEREGLA